MTTRAQVAADVSRTRALDPVTLEVIRHGLTAAAEQMATVIERSAQSQVVREMLDYSTAVFDVSGGITAQSTRIPMHLNSMTRALRTMLTRFPIDQWGDGDVYATNDPYSGGQHLPDIQTFAPVAVDGRLVAITGTLAHHLDVGGRGAASYGADATEIYQEGIRTASLSHRHRRGAERAVLPVARGEHPRPTQDARGRPRADRRSRDRRCGGRPGRRALRPRDPSRRDEGVDRAL